MNVAILGSRKGRHVAPEAWWLRAAFALSGHLARAGHRVWTSAGNLPYASALYGAARAGGHVTAVTDSRHLPQLLECLPPGFDRDRLLDVRLLPEGAGLARDQAITDAVDLAIAVAVRSGGQMAHLLHERWQNGKAVEILDPGPVSCAAAAATVPAGDDAAGNLELLDAGLPPLSPERRGVIEALPPPRGPETPPAGLLDAFARWDADPLPGPILAHFTRACPGPWPGQPRWSYLEDLFTGGWRARRDTMATLSHILEERRIRASSRLIRGGHGVVSFTANRPEVVVGLHRYRRHLLRWDFEPCGLVFDRAWLERQGARPVEHLPADAYPELPAHRRPWFQKLALPACDYREEKEWRVLGDVDFGSVPSDAIRIVCPPGGP